MPMAKYLKGYCYKKRRKPSTFEENACIESNCMERVHRVRGDYGFASPQCRISGPPPHPLDQLGFCAACLHNAMKGARQRCREHDQTRHKPFSRSSHHLSLAIIVFSNGLCIRSKNIYLSCSLHLRSPRKFHEAEMVMKKLDIREKGN